MCHPGRFGPGLRSAPTRLKESREEELLALTSPEARQRRWPNRRCSLVIIESSEECGKMELSSLAFTWLL